VPHRLLFLTSYVGPYVLIYGGSLVGAAVTASAFFVWAAETVPEWAPGVGFASVLMAFTGFMKTWFDAAQRRRETEATSDRLEREFRAEQERLAREFKAEQERLARELAAEQARQDREAREKRHALRNQLQQALLEIAELKANEADLKKILISNRDRIDDHDRAIQQAGSGSGIFPALPPPGE
jgi:Skp family chaperone for outer membrane proteins